MFIKNSLNNYRYIYSIKFILLFVLQANCFEKKYVVLIICLTVPTLTVYYFNKIVLSFYYFTLYYNVNICCMFNIFFFVFVLFILHITSLLIFCCISVNALHFYSIFYFLLIYFAYRHLLHTVVK